MIYYKTNEEVELLRKSNLLVSETLALVAKEIKPGISTIYLDKLAAEFIQDNQAKPAFKGYKGFPYTCCISVNNAVVHGFPTHAEIKEGDIISVDTGVILNGYVGDSAYTFAVGEIPESVQQLLRITKESLYKGIEKAKVGYRIGDIGWAIQEHTEVKNGYGVVRSLTGHGIGKSLHEDPEVPNYGRRGNGLKLQEGLVIAIEPMINMGTKEVYVGDDDWTIFTADSMLSAHYEHSVVVRKTKADILSSFTPIEAAEKANPALFDAYYVSKE
ncbi:MAG: type I methionyl aminopeptidase [Bacteroidetes bacterium]|nr:type I methionyl aminopeptidase [Bacteroidota bacterium]MBK6821285.1 type I methionyl aminopeptidase [Bacteroidota bacterium]MBK7040204.1 type I methionyl aminopeptidase [Bacteroidota bacterium]MBK9300019.1 type I methionyl aminopeptidase [Bacteroidota bacterium]MBK9481911.1 type I methionyl aminopeptidase [Bacteroidota bacterium]